jgi:hypothetical protein
MVDAPERLCYKLLIGPGVLAERRVVLYDPRPFPLQHFQTFFFRNLQEIYQVYQFYFTITYFLKSPIVEEPEVETRAVVTTDICEQVVNFNFSIKLLVNLLSCRSLLVLLSRRRSKMLRPLAMMTMIITGWLN